MYNVFRITLKMNDKFVGSLPLNTEALESYVKARFKDAEDLQDTQEHIGTDLDLDDESEQSIVGFKKDETHGIYGSSYQVVAMIAQSASLLGITTKKHGTKQTLREGCVVKGLLPKHLYEGTEAPEGETELIYTGDKLFCDPLKKESEGLVSRTGSVSGPSGSRSIVSMAEYVSDVTLRFEVWLLQNRMVAAADGKKFSPQDFKRCLAHARHLGLGGQRKYNCGTFSVETFEEMPALSEDAIIDF